MKHVLVETNWVVAYAAPKHLRVRTALDLAVRAEDRELQLHIPSCCLTEARHPIRTKNQPRGPADAIRKYLAWGTAEGIVDAGDSLITRRILDQYEKAVSAELQELESRIETLLNHPGIEVFPLNEKMLDRAVTLSTKNLDLKPFDQAILASVLVRAEILRDSGFTDVSFCELDGDLQPWDKNGHAKQPLTDLYDSAHVWVYGDFSMESPQRRASFS